MPYRLCELSPQRAGLRLFWKDSAGKPFGSLAALDRQVRARGQRLLLAMNAGMYEPDSLNTPVGLYVEDGRELVRLNTRAGSGNFYHQPNGVFYVAGGRAAVVETLEFEKSGFRPDLATQSGPMLVRRGRFPHADYRPTGPAVPTRNAVGVRADGTVVLVIADGATNMHAFRLALRDHFALQDALFLDGAVSQLYVAPGAPPGGGTFGAILAVIAR